MSKRTDMLVLVQRDNLVGGKLDLGYWNNKQHQVYVTVKCSPCGDAKKEEWRYYLDAEQARGSFVEMLNPDKSFDTLQPHHRGRTKDEMIQYLRTLD